MYQAVSSVPRKSALKKQKIFRIKTLQNIKTELFSKFSTKLSAFVSENTFLPTVFCRTMVWPFFNGDYLLLNCFFKCNWVNRPFCSFLSNTFFEFVPLFALINIRFTSNNLHQIFTPKTSDIRLQVQNISPDVIKSTLETLTAGLHHQLSKPLAEMIFSIQGVERTRNRVFQLLGIYKPSGILFLWFLTQIKFAKLLS